MARWVIQDYNIMDFLKGLKAMSKVGPEVHVEPFGDRGLKLQTTNAARSVYFQIIYKSDYFQETDEQSQSQVFIYKCAIIQGVIIRPTPVGLIFQDYPGSLGKC